MFTTKELSDKVNRYIADWHYSRRPEGLYAPIQYVLSLGGKRLRPVLMILGRWCCLIACRTLKHVLRCLLIMWFVLIRLIGLLTVRMLRLRKILGLCFLIQKDMLIPYSMLSV